MKKIFAAFILSSCVTVDENEKEKKAGIRYACINDFYTFLEDKSNRSDVFPITQNSIVIGNTNFGNIVVLRDDDLVEVITSQRNCKKDPKSCKENEIVRLTKPFAKEFATGYIFKNDSRHKKFIGDSLRLASSCLKKLGDTSTAAIFEREAKKI